VAEQDLLALADERLADWNRRAAGWYTVYYALGALAVVLTITVASRPPILEYRPGSLPTLAWPAAIFQGLSTFLVTLPKATAYRAAWRTLWLARLEYVDSQRSEDTAKALKQAVAAGWAIIDGGYVADTSPRASRKRSR
jgi:hypothetical protein